MERPKILPTQATDEMYANVRYHLDGELVPMLTVEMPAGGAVYFEHHVLLWKHPAVNIGIRPMQGAFKRMMAGMQIFVTEAQGPGQIAFSRDGAGHIVPIHITAGEELHVREHQFLAATANVDYTFERVKGVANLLFGGTGFFIDKFHGHKGDGILWRRGSPPACSPDSTWCSIASRARAGSGSSRCTCTWERAFEGFSMSPDKDPGGNQGRFPSSIRMILPPGPTAHATSPLAPTAQ